VPGHAAIPVTIIIPTYNRASVLQSTLDQIGRQNFQDYELWVIDQSDFEEAEAVRVYMETISDKRLHYLRLRTKGLPNARNEGLARARGKIILFLDDDVILLTADFIRAHVDAYHDSTIGGVVGRHVERRLRMNARHTVCKVSWGGRTVFNLFGTKRVTVESCKGSNMSFRMTAVSQIGGFDRRTELLEETDFSTRLRSAGWKLIFEPAAELLHLSVQAGGVRRHDILETEARRFYFTAYYILKHRGVAGIPSFLATFTLIALLKAFHFRSIRAVPTLWLAIFTGFMEARKGPDQLLPAPDELKDE
jgi:GT2 family glycosyltransferase